VKESMYRYMNVGLIQFMAYPDAVRDESALIDSVRKIALDPFFNVIELTSVPSQKTRLTIRQMLETAHMSAVFGAQPMLLSSGLNINDLDEDKRKQAVALLQSGIDEAIELGASSFAFLSGRYQPETIEASLDALVRSTQTLCDYAAARGGIRVALEVFDHTIDKKSLIGPAALARRYAEQVMRPRDEFGLIVDLSHLPLLGETPEQAIVPIAEYLVHAHIGNCVIKNPDLPGYGDLHPRFGFPDSENDVEELMEYLRILKKIGYLSAKRSPTVSFEVKPFDGEDPDLVVANAKRVLQKAWARL